MSAFGALVRQWVLSAESSCKFSKYHIRRRVSNYCEVISDEGAILRSFPTGFGSNLLPILLLIRLSLSFDLLFQFFDFPAHLFEFFRVQQDFLLRIAISEFIVGRRQEDLGVRLRAGDIGDAIG